VSVAVYLIDFDNVRPDAGVPHRNRDCSMAADHVRRQALEHARNYGGITEVRLRYYGGWFLKRGDASYDARDLRRWITRAPRRDGELLVATELASSLLAQPLTTFYGTLRLPGQQVSALTCGGLCARHCRQAPHQKMVDAMLSLALVHISSLEPVHVVLYSSDEDLLPSVLLAAKMNGRATKITWLRPGRPSGDSPNDVHLIAPRLAIQERP
jgi:hypothetical protein